MEGKSLLPVVGAYIQASTKTGLVLGYYTGKSKVYLANGEKVPFTQWEYVFDGWM